MVMVQPHDESVFIQCFGIILNYPTGEILAAIKQAMAMAIANIKTPNILGNS